MTDLSTYRDKAINLAKIACSLDKQEKYEEGYKHCLEAVEYFLYVVKCKHKFVQNKHSFLFEFHCTYSSINFHFIYRNPVLNLKVCR
jgi:hypothetical protein